MAGEEPKSRDRIPRGSARIQRGGGTPSWVYLLVVIIGVAVIAVFLFSGGGKKKKAGKPAASAESVGKPKAKPASSEAEKPKKAAGSTGEALPEPGEPDIKTTPTVPKTTGGDEMM